MHDIGALFYQHLKGKGSDKHVILELGLSWLQECVVLPL